MSSYSYEGIVEYYLDASRYSQEALEKFNRYKFLAEKESKSKDEYVELSELISYLDKVPPIVSKELVFAFKESEQKRKEFT